MPEMLIITTYFPPMGEFAAARVKSIIKYLLRLGWKIYVVTTVDPNYVYRADEVLKNICIHATAKSSCDSIKNRVKCVLSRNIAALRRVKRIGKAALNIFGCMKWTCRAFNIATKIIKNKKVDFIYVSVPGIEPLLTGHLLKKTCLDYVLFVNTGIPYR